VRAVGRPKLLLATFGAARAAYARGDYDAAAALTTPLDGICRRLLVGGRAIVAAGGALLGVLLVWAVAIAGIGKPWAYATAAVGAAVVGALAWWQGTSPDTRREIRFLAASLLVSGALGVGLGHWAGLGRDSGAGDTARSAAEPFQAR
jgi:hypothetical protein